MVNLAAAAPTVLAAFLASAVEVVEAFTIVLAVSVVRGLRPALLGTRRRSRCSALSVVLFGPLLSRVPVHGLQIVVGVLLLVFGLGWLRKAILRAGGAMALHDEPAAFASESETLRAERADDFIAGLAAFKAVLLEGTEVVFIVWPWVRGRDCWSPRLWARGPLASLVLVAGTALRAPLSRVPENTLKFAVGSLLSGFGLFWCAEGMKAPFPGDDAAIFALVALFAVAGLAMTALVRARMTRVAA